MATTPAIGNHWGVGTGDHGLGQPTSTPPTDITNVAVGQTVTAVKWSSLFGAIDKCLKHQGLSNAAPTSVNVGDKITYSAALPIENAKAYNNSGTTAMSLSTIATDTTTYSNTWSVATFTQIVTFQSGNAARYFFNAGGKIELTFSRTGGTSNTVNTNFTNLCAAAGIIQLGWHNTTKTGGSGTTAILLNANNGGYWSGTGTNVVHFKQFDTASGSTTNYIQVEYYWSGAVQNGGYPVLNIKTTFDGNSNNYDGVTTVIASAKSPATTYINNTWGTPTITGTSLIR